jgi:hypothetical protein
MRKLLKDEGAEGLAGVHRVAIKDQECLLVFRQLEPGLLALDVWNKDMSHPL